MASLAKRFRRQVEAEALLRFNPERSAIEAQLAEAKGTRKQAVRAARGVARGIQAAADQAQPRLAAGYGEARDVLSRVEGDVQRAVGALGPVADPLRASMARDSAGTQRRLAETLAGASAELTQRRFDAEAGKANAIGLAHSQYASESSKLGERLRQLGIEEGAFQQGRTGELVESARDRRTTVRENRRDRRARARLQEDDQAFTREEKAKDRAASRGPGGVKRATPEAHDEWRDKFAEALAVAQRRKAALEIKGVTGRDARRRTADLLVKGREEVPEEVNWERYDELRKKDPNMSEAEAKAKATEPGLPALEPFQEKLASIALDVAYDGHVSRENAKWLHRQGFTLKDLGLPSYTTVKGGSRRSRSQRPGNAPAGRRGQTRPT